MSTPLPAEHAHRQAPYRTIPKLLQAREPFQGSSLSAGPPLGYVGRLMGPDRRAYIQAVDSGALAYEVRSYRTPIAWVLSDEHGEHVHLVPERFSPTTSRHQVLCRAWL